MSDQKPVLLDRTNYPPGWIDREGGSVAEAWRHHELDDDAPGIDDLRLPHSRARPTRAESWAMYWPRAAFGREHPEHWPGCISWTDAYLATWTEPGRRQPCARHGMLDHCADRIAQPIFGEAEPATPPDPEGFARDIRRDAPQLRDLVPDPLLDRVRADLIAEIVKGLDERFLRYGLNFTQADLRSALGNILDTRAAIEAFSRLRGETIRGDAPTSIVGGDYMTFTVDSPDEAKPAKTPIERRRAIAFLCRYGHLPYDTISTWTDAQLDEMGEAVDDLMDEEDDGDDDEATARFDASQPPEVVTFAPQDQVLGSGAWQEHLERAAAGQPKTILAPAAGAMSGKTGEPRLTRDKSGAVGMLWDGPVSLDAPTGVDYAAGPDRTVVSEVMLVDGKPRTVREIVMDEAATETVLGDSMTRQSRRIADIWNEAPKTRERGMVSRAAIAAWIDGRQVADGHEDTLRVTIGQKIKLRCAENCGITRWRWLFQAIPDGSQASLGGAYGVSTEFVADVAGTWRVELQTNEANEHNRAAVTIVVEQPQELSARKPRNAPQELVEVPLSFEGNRDEPRPCEVVVAGVVTRVLSLRAGLGDDFRPSSLAVTLEENSATRTRILLVMLATGQKAPIGGYAYLASWWLLGEQHEVFYLVAYEPAEFAPAT